MKNQDKNKQEQKTAQSNARSINPSGKKPLSEKEKVIRGILRLQKQSYVLQLDRAECLGPERLKVVKAEVAKSINEFDLKFPEFKPKFIITPPISELPESEE